MVIGSQRSSSHGQELVANERPRLFLEPDFSQRAGEIIAAVDGPFVRDTTRGQPPGEDLASDHERFVVSPEIIVKAEGKVGLSDEDTLFVVPKIATTRSQMSLEHPERFFGSRFAKGVSE